jgi:hypothetical protein
VEALGDVYNIAVMIINFVFHLCSPFPVKDWVKSFFIFELWAFVQAPFMLSFSVSVY